MKEYTILQTEKIKSIIGDNYCFNEMIAMASMVAIDILISENGFSVNPKESIKEYILKYYRINDANVLNKITNYALFIASKYVANNIYKYDNIYNEFNKAVNNNE